MVSAAGPDVGKIIRDTMKYAPVVGGVFSHEIRLMRAMKLGVANPIRHRRIRRMLHPFHRVPETPPDPFVYARIQICLERILISSPHRNGGMVPPASTTRVLEAAQYGQRLSPLFPEPPVVQCLRAPLKLWIGHKCLHSPILHRLEGLWQPGPN